MSKSPQAKADRIEGAEQGYPVRINSGRLTSVNGTVGIAFIAPFDGYISEAHVNIDTAFTNAAASFQIGTYADPDALLDDPTIKDLTGFVDFSGYASGADGWISKAITKGTLYFASFVNADTTGNGTIGLTLTPGPGPLA